MDDTLNIKRSGTRVVLEGIGNILIEKSLIFEFRACNNLEKYKALIVSRVLALEMGASN